MYQRLLFLSLFLGILPDTIAQQKTDVIYRLDQTFLEAIIDEVGESDILYFLPKDSQKRPQKIRKQEVWKLVYANGDVEEINPLPKNSPLPETVEKSDLIFRKDNTIIEAKILKISDNRVTYTLFGKEIERHIPIQEISKIVYSDGNVEQFNQPSLPEPVAVQPFKEEKVVRKPTTARQRPKIYVGLLGGGVMSSFYRSELLNFPQKPLFNWEMGLTASLVSRRYYQMRLEGVYVTKGARETFSDNTLRITSENRLRYVQANFFPLILKTGSEGLNFAVGAGGYYACLLNLTSQYAIGDETFNDDEVTKQLFKNTPDYGFCALAGLYNRQKPLVELRYAYGIVPLMEKNNIKNHGFHLSFFLTF
ncbi:hypothetical protein [Runella sp.]|uniref:hypothetical protein n=1 Tax=Runella sp. TaxID=1960881 RepID=UPI0030198C5A